MRAQDLRRALVFVSFLVADGDWPAGSPVQLLTPFIDTLQGRSIRLGWLYDKGWQTAKANAQLGDVITAILHVAACGLHLQGCYGARLAQGVQVLEGMVDVDWSMLVWWPTGRPQITYYAEHVATQRVLVHRLVGDPD